MEEIFAKLYDMTAFSNIIADPSFLVMYAIAFILLYLGIKKHYEPLLLVPIAFGVLIANFPGGDMGVIQADENGMVMVNGVLKNIWEMPLHEIAHDLGLMNFIYYMLIKTGFLPPIIFMGVGALTDFGPMLRNLRLSIFGAAAQLGIFTVLLCAVMIGFTPQEAGALGIIGGADGPTAIFTTIKLAPHLLGPIAIAAYSYMALVPVIIPLVVKLFCSKKELMINMKEQEKLYPSKTEIKNLRVLKIIFPIAVTTIVALFVPTAVPLIGMLMFGNLIKEIGADTSRLFDAAANSIMNAATIFLGLSVGATMTSEAFLNFLRQQKGIIVAPSKAVNAGGVGVSALEMAQNSERLVWTAEEVDAQLHKMMKTIHKESADAAAEYGLGYDLVAGANIAGFKKVAEAMMEQGCF